jgi:hypothetical protein
MGMLGPDKEGVKSSPLVQIGLAATQKQGFPLNYSPYLQYDKALADGVPIATGGIAGACRHLVTGPGESYWVTLEVKRRRSRAPLTPIKRSNVGRAGLAV